MCEHSLINIALFDKYPKLLNQFSKDSNYTDIYNFCYTYLKEDFDINLPSIEQKIKYFESMVTFADEIVFWTCILKFLSI